MLIFVFFLISSSLCAYTIGHTAFAGAKVNLDFGGGGSMGANYRTTYCWELGNVPASYTTGLYFNFMGFACSSVDDTLYFRVFKKVGTDWEYFDGGYRRFASWGEDECDQSIFEKEMNQKVSLALTPGDYLVCSGAKNYQLTADAGTTTTVYMISGGNEAFGYDYLPPIGWKVPLDGGTSGPTPLIYFVGETFSCDPPCVHGTCEEPDYCFCEEGWEDGYTCETPICNNMCTVHGECVRPDVCDCEPGWKGDLCDTITPPEYNPEDDDDGAGNRIWMSLTLLVGLVLLILP